MANKKLMDKKVFNEIAKSRSSLIITHGSNIQEVISSIVKYFTDKGYSGIYLSLNKPHKTVEGILQKRDVQLKKVFYIDCITASVHAVDKEDTTSVVYLNHPDNLSQMRKVMDAVDKFAFSVPEDKFFIVDTLRTILLYHEPKIVSKLVQDLIRELQGVNIKFIVLTRSEEDNSVINMISHHFDVVLDL